MGLDNRDYLRDESRRYGGGSSFGSPMEQRAPMCRRLLIINVVVFVAQILSVGDWKTRNAEVRRERLIGHNEPLQVTQSDGLGTVEEESQRLRSAQFGPGASRRTSLVQDWLQLETPKVFSGQIWRLVTCAFCHDRMNLFHILFNMLFLWWFGPKIESMYGPKEFLAFYLTAAVVASLSYIGLDIVTGDPVPMVGASGAVMGVVMLFAMHFPTTIIYVMFIIPVEIRWIVLLYAIFDLHPVLLSLAGEGGFDKVAHAAHLGGLAFGYIYGRQQLRLYPMISNLEMWWKRRRSGFKVVSDTPTVSRKSQRLADEMDAILQKISEQGEASLTSSERKTLERASRELRDRRS